MNEEQLPDLVEQCLARAEHISGRSGPKCWMNERHTKADERLLEPAEQSLQYVLTKVNELSYVSQHRAKPVIQAQSRAVFLPSPWLFCYFVLLLSGAFPVVA